MVENAIHDDITLVRHHVRTPSIKTLTFFLKRIKRSKNTRSPRGSDTERIAQKLLGE